MQQHYGELCLQMADALGQLALAATQLLGSQGEAARIDQHGKGGQIIHFTHGIVSKRKPKVAY